MFSVTPEPAASKPAYAAYDSQARQVRTDQPPSDGFATLVDSNAAAASDSRSAPDAPPSSRRDQRDARRTDTPVNNDAPQSSASSAPNDNSSPQKDAGSSTPANADAGSDKSPGKVKASGGKKNESKKTEDAETAAVPTVPAIIADAVAVVVTVTTEAATTPADGTSSTPAAIAASAAAAATAAITSASSAVQNGDPSLAETPVATATTDTGTSVAAELAAGAPADGAAPEANAAKIVATASVIHSANGKTDASAKNADTVASIKDNKDGKQTADTSSAVTDQAIKPETAPNADGKPGQHDKAASDTATETPERTTKTTSQTEHRASAAPAPLPAPQSDSGLQFPAAMQQQPIQTHAANLTAIPVTPAQAALAANTPVPLNSLAADIALRAAGGNSRFEIRLDPAELGRIDVRLEVDKHGNVTSHLTVERPATLDMLRSDAPKLQQALEDAGLKTGDSGLQFSLRDQSSSGQNNDSGASRNSQRVIITDEDTVPAQVAGRTYGRMLGASGGVDIRI